MKPKRPSKFQEPGRSLQDKSMTEFEIKQQRIRELLAAHQLDALLL